MTIKKIFLVVGICTGLFFGACGDSNKGSDAGPSFGEEAVDDQDYLQNFPINTLALPAATGGDGELRYSLVPLPDGLSFNSATNVLSGTPPTVGRATVTYIAQDADGDIDTIMFSIKIRLAEPRNICDRTQEVQDAILTKIHETDNTVTCDTVNEAHLWSLSGSLNVRNSGITVLQEDDFNDLPNLQRLILERNAITSIPENLFEDLTNLEALSLDNNGITNFPSLAGLTKLTSFEAHGNAITSIPENAFEDNDRLREITLNSNSITGIPANLFDGLSSLQELNLGHNSFTSLPEGIFDGLSNLRELRLDILRNIALPANVFDGLSSLQTITLLNNRITNFPGGLFDGLDSLTCLDLRGNFLGSTPGICSSGVTCDAQCN